MGVELWVPIIAIVFGCTTAVVIVGIVLWFEHKKQAMRSQERLAAIEKGVQVADLSEDGASGHHRGNALYRGIRWLFIGLGLAIALYFNGGMTTAVWGLFVAFIGLGHLVYWVFVGRKEEGPRD